jgi:outer membrane lipoprotein carrier protein
MVAVKYWFQVVISGLASYLAWTAISAATLQVDATYALAALLEPMTKYAADFNQVVIGRRGEVLQNISGTVHLRRPGCLRWEVTEPYQQLVLSDGAGLYVFDQDLEQVTLQPLDDSIQGTPALLLSGKLDDLGSIFTIVQKENNPKQRVFGLIPKSDQSLFRQIRLTFDPRRLIEIDIVDHFELATRITFTNSTIDPVLESGIFKFVIPEGIDVIGDVPDRDPSC